MKSLVCLIFVSFFITSPTAWAADTTAPKLLSWTLKGSSFDVTNSSASPVVEFSVSDDSEISTPALTLNSSTTSQSSGFATVEVISKNGNTTTYRATATLVKGSAPGD